MADDSPNLDNPHVAHQAEVMKNRLYRAFESSEIDIEPSDFEILSDAMSTLTEDEHEQLGRLSLELEEEGRDEYEFDEITETDREYFELLETALERYRS